MPHTRIVVCCIIASCSNAWTKEMTLTPEALPFGPHDNSPTIQEPIHVVEKSKAALSHRSTMRGSFPGIEADDKASPTSQMFQIASPASIWDITTPDLVMLGTETQRTRLAFVWWLTIIVFGVPVACGLFYAAVSLATANFAAIFEDSQASALAGKVGDSVSLSAASPSGGRLVGQSPKNVKQSPLVGGRISLDAIPPPFCATQRSLQSMTSFWVDAKSLHQLQNRSAIDIKGAFDYPVLRARLCGGFGGTRLEVATEPSFREILGSVTPMDYPGQLNQNSLLYGPKCALYGPIRRSGPNFGVGHFARIENVFTMKPTRTSDGFALEINSNSYGTHQLASAHMVDGRSRYQIDVNSGVDHTLMIICFLAVFISSQKRTDDVATVSG